MALTARSPFDPGEFLEIFVGAPIEGCERRDPKVLYAKARRGELANFTGIDSRYEAPTTPDIRLDTVAQDVENCVDHLLRFF
jgi:adenylylsulfate kinase-like enzyme